MSGRQGYQERASANSDFNAYSFVVKQLLGRIGTATVVKVVAVTNTGGVSPAGNVDVLPLVNQVDGAGNAVPHGTVHHLPYSRLQGGTNAIIMDPQVGDIGVAVFASRDISSVKANKGQANPGSRRRFDMADGIYCGAILNGTPVQYVRFTDTGITLHSPLLVTIDAANIVLTGNVAITGTLTNNSVTVGSTHVHSDPQGGNTGVPH